MIQLQKKSANHLISAYNQMIKVMQEAFAQSNTGDMSLQKALKLAKHQVVLPGKISSEEAFAIGEYIKLDVNEAAEQMMESSAEFYDWLMLDIEEVERKVMVLFLSVAEHTRQELEQFKRAKPSAEFDLHEQLTSYKSGEIAQPGILVCENCGNTEVFFSSGTISRCECCEHDYFFQRQAGDN